MATNTPRLSLRKPANSDLVNVVTDLAENFDKLDIPAYIAALAADLILSTKVTGDTNPRFKLLADGTHTWQDPTDANPAESISYIPGDFSATQSGLILPNNVVRTANIKDGAVSSQKLGLTIATAENNTQDNVGGGSGFQDAVAGAFSTAITVGASGRLLVLYQAEQLHDDPSGYMYTSIELSGANTQAAADHRSIRMHGNTAFQMASFIFYQGLSAGATTITMKHKPTGGSVPDDDGTVDNRFIFAVCL